MKNKDFKEMNIEELIKFLENEFDNSDDIKVPEEEILKELNCPLRMTINSFKKVN